MQLFVNHLTTIDCTYLDPEFGLMGASWIVDIVLEGELDYQGMVMDFGDVKKHIKDVIDSSLDHTLLVPTKYKDVEIEQQSSSCTVTYVFSKGKIEHISPIEAVSLLEVEHITISALEDFLNRIISASLPENRLSVDIVLREEEIEGARYGYSHGLKLHEGNCQRIAHGHRSRIKIMEKSARSTDLEQEWAQRWHGQYLANKIDIKRSFEENGIAYTVFAYEASQGSFKLTIPTTCCSLIDNETTIEYLGQHICETLCQETGKTLKVFAYEGVNKGAIAG